MNQNRDDELTRFKIGINLAEYAQSLGYQIDRHESSKASIVMRNGEDKVIVATDQDGHGIYFSIRDNKDHGSIIDFLQTRKNVNLGQVRKELRPWIGESSSSHRPILMSEQRRIEKPTPSTADRQQVLAAWMKMHAIDGHHSYLERERKLSSSILSDPRFGGAVRQDARGNAVFAHFDRDGLAGYELKNNEFTGFATSGTKAIWHSANLPHAPRVVIVESAIDALSHAQLANDPEAAYVSVGGSMSDHQRELVQSVIAKASARGAEIVIATDSDEAGRKLAAELKALAPPEAALSENVPKVGKDWNDQLHEAVKRELAIAKEQAQVPEQQRHTHRHRFTMPRF